MTHTHQACRWIAGAETPAHDDYDADVVILSLDRTDATLAAIHSVLSQTGATTHLWVLDQGSGPDVLNRFAAAVAGQRRATLFAASENLGVAGGRNVLSGLGRGRVIVALDNDAEFGSRDAVAQLVAALDAEPRLAAVGCRIVRRMLPLLH